MSQRPKHQLHSNGFRHTLAWDRQFASRTIVSHVIDTDSDAGKDACLISHIPVRGKSLKNQGCDRCLMIGVYHYRSDPAFSKFQWRFVYCWKSRSQDGINETWRCLLHSGMLTLSPVICPTDVLALPPRSCAGAPRSRLGRALRSAPLAESKYPKIASPP